MKPAAQCEPHASEVIEYVAHTHTLRLRARVILFLPPNPKQLFELRSIQPNILQCDCEFLSFLLGYSN